MTAIAISARLVLALCFAATALTLPEASAEEPAWWTAQKRKCNLPSSLDYNSWVENGSKCSGASPRPPARATGSSGGNASGVDQQARLRAEEQARQLAEERARRDRDAAAQRAFIADRDKSVGALKGPPAGSAPTIDGLKGINDRSPDLKGLATQRNYKSSGNGLVGGTTWRVGYYVPEGASKEVRDRALRMLREQAALAGIPYSESVDLGRYNFVIGIADSTKAWIDLPIRVWADQLSNGKWSTGVGGLKGQELYNSLRDRQFDELGCHSNGAMICLAALMKGDVKATKVVLYGPQLTPEALRMWQELRKDRKIGSLVIYVNQNDPVTPASLVISPALAVMANPSIANASDLALQTKALLFNVDNVQTAIQQIAPLAEVMTFKCGTGLSVANCHGMATYTTDRGCLRVQPTPTAVPGTKVAGRSAMSPPSPLCPTQ